MQSHLEDLKKKVLLGTNWLTGCQLQIQGRFRIWKPTFNCLSSSGQGRIRHWKRGKWYVCCNVFQTCDDLPQLWFMPYSLTSSKCIHQISHEDNSWWWPNFRTQTKIIFHSVWGSRIVDMLPFLQQQNFFPIIMEGTPESQEELFDTTWKVYRPWHECNLL